MRGGGKGEPESGIEVNEGNDIPSGAVDVLLKGIKGDHVSRIPGNQSPRLSQGFYASERLNPPCAGDAQRDHPETAEVDNKAADCADARNLCLVLRTELLYERK